MSPTPFQLSGPAPLTPRFEPWMTDLLSDPVRCEQLLADHGSPVNLIDTTPVHRNVDELLTAAAESGVDVLVQVARKANKALAIVDEAIERGYGVDVGSEAELRQVLDRGMPPERIIVTAAVKPKTLRDLCLSSGAVVALDNIAEAEALAVSARERGQVPQVALRLQPPQQGPWVSSRFGEQVDTWRGWIERNPGVQVIGLHFHLHGYDATQRAAMVRVALNALDERAFGPDVRFIDIGGGVPMSYLDDGREWSAFWELHRELLAGANPLTWQANQLTNVYPYHQELIRGDWLRTVLSDERDGVSVGAALAARGLQLRCEPGRSVLDGVGVTLARVAFTKRTSDGKAVVALEMNRTQCRSTSDDFLVDPVLVRGVESGDAADSAAMGPAGSTEASADLVDAFLMGAYCIESELLLTRRLRVPSNLREGDMVAFINTGGYLMHILESASHQIPLAKNVSRRDSSRPFMVDPIDAPKAC